MFLRKLIAVVLMPVFLLCSIALAQDLSCGEDALAPRYISEILDEYRYELERFTSQATPWHGVTDAAEEARIKAEFEKAFKGRSDYALRLAEFERAYAFQEAWVAKTAEFLAAKIAKKVMALGGKVSLREAEEEVIGRINDRTKQGIPRGRRAKLIAVIRDEFKKLRQEPGGIAGEKSFPAGDDESVARENFEMAIEKMRGSDKIRSEDKVGLENILRELYDRALPYFRQASKINPVHHNTRVLDNMVRIGLAEYPFGDGNEYKKSLKNFKFSVIAALLHDVGIALSDKPRIRSGQIKAAVAAGDIGEAKWLAEASIAFRREHMDKGSRLAVKLLTPLFNRGELLFWDIDAICAVINEHDYPSLENSVNELRKMGVDIGYPQGKFLFSSVDTDHNKTLQYLREADRLFMLTYEGVLEDLKADNSAPTPENVRAKLRSNMNGHREEFKMYKANGKDDGAFIDGTLYRTKAGYSIFANAPNEIEKSISQAGFAGMGLRDLERKQGAVIDSKLHMALAANGPKMWAVAQGAAVDGSFAIDTEGNQGYYVNGGKELFLSSVANMKDFFKQRAERLGKPIKYIIKPGIGGQHTPFQAIADSFQVIDAESGIVTGEYQLGKDYESAMAETLRRLGAAWGQVAVIPSSKSGSTDETMMIFSEILYVLLKHAVVDGVDGGEFADSVFDTLHEVNFIDGKERATRDLFKVEDGRFGTASLIDLIARRANERGLSINRGQVKDIFAGVLGNMVFETVNNSAESRLAAFINNSKLGDELGEDRPRFTTMFDNVGGRWTADLHMMTFLAYHNLDAGSYWTSRYEAIKKVREGGHVGVRMAGRILDEDITDIALVVPDELFWFGKAIEQNFNESIWQEGFANLVAVKESLWEAQKANYADNPGRFVINLTGISIPNDSFNIENLGAVDVRGMDKQRLANSLGELFTTFYGMTHTVGNELLARAVILERQRAEDIDMENPANPAANIIRKNLYLFQPYVELGKKLLDARLQELQKQEAAKPGTIEAEFEKTRQLAREGRLESDIPDMPAKVMNVEQLTAVMLKAKQFADRNGRKFAPFIYLEGGKFYNLRDHLSGQGIEWVMQGTGDQHISFQQVLSQPQKYLPFVISLVPERALPGRKAIGFGKGYLNDVSPHMVRDYFAEASYRALVELRKEQGGLGLFLRMTDSEANLGMLRRSAEEMRSMIEKAKIGETPVTEAIPAARFVDLTSARPGMAGKIAPTLGDRVGEIESSVRRIAANLQLYPENTVPSGDIVIITKSSWVAKGTKGEEAADNSSLDSTAKAMLKGRYEAMIQGLREAFPNNRNIVGVSTQDELIATISDLVNNQRVKVVVLDDGALTTGIDTRLGEIAGQAGKDYCVVAADLSEKPVLTEMKFINLNAMALMGAAILSNNGVLFTDAYKLFTGEEPPQNLIADGRINWFVKALPRIVPFDVNKADDQRLVNKLFRVSA